MSQLTKTRLLTLMCFIFMISTFTACHKDTDVANNGKVQLLSFGPTGAQPGDTLRFIGLNLNKVDSIQFTGTNAIVEQKNFIQQSADLILVIVPQSTEKGYVTLKTTDGDVVTKTQLNLGVAAVETSMTAQARPGENITITGNYLNWVSKVTFAKNLEVTTFVSQSLNKLVVAVPADAQTGPLQLTYQGTDSGVLVTKDTLKVTLPVATALSPNPVKHQTNVTITGTDLDLVKQVLFTGVSTPVTDFVSQSATQVVVKVPASTTKGKITLVAASGVQTTSTADLDVVLPSITTMSPNPVDPNANVTIAGSNLDVVSAVSFVASGDVKTVSSFVSKTATQLVVKVPAGVVTGKITLSVVNSTLTVKSSTDLKIVGSAVPPIIIYDDAVTSAWNGWIGDGWGGSKDVNNTSPVKSGTKSVKISYTSGGYGVPFQLGGANLPLSGYTSLKVSIYGGTGSDGKTVNIGFNEKDGKTVTVAAGKWTDFTIPLSDISSMDVINALYIKNFSASGDFTIYVDNLGIY